VILLTQGKDMGNSHRVQGQDFTNENLEVQHFRFEDDILDNKMKCIPMIVRLKLDAVGIKLMLGEWAKLSSHERIELATKASTTADEKKVYKNHVNTLVHGRTGHDA